MASPLRYQRRDSHREHDCIVMLVSSSCTRISTKPLPRQFGQVMRPSPLSSSSVGIGSRGGDLERATYRIF
jgi:hypothetical protein